MEFKKPIRLKPKAETIKFLLLRSSNQCAFPDCNNEIFNSKNELVAECCHIEAAMPQGERFNENSTNEYRRSYENLLFLCHSHHVVTNNTEAYTVERLKEIKANHENQFSSKNNHVDQLQIDLVLKEFEEVKNRTINIDETVQRIENKQDDLFDVLSGKLKKEGLSTPIEYLMPPVVTDFFGRKKESDLLDKYLNTHSCIQVSGISGIGKSSFVAKEISRRNIKALWVDCTTTNSLSEFQNILAQYLKVEYKDNRFDKDLKHSNSNLESVFQRLDEKELCIILDALDSNSHHLSKLVEFCSRRFAKSKLIYTTTVEHSFLAAPNAVANLKLSGIDTEGFKSFISHMIGEEVDPITEFQYYKVTGGHPFLIRLVSSLLPYQPLDSLLEELGNQPNEEVAKFLTTKVYDKLEIDEKELITYILHLGIPFQYEFINFIQGINTKKSFTNLQRKSLIERKQSDLFYIPDFLIPYLKSFVGEISNEAYYTVASHYLRSLDDKARIFERWALIQIEIQLNNFTNAQNLAKPLFSRLMVEGKFGLLLNLALQLEECEEMNDSAFTYYCIGRVYRFQEFHEESLKYYEKGISKPGEPRMIEVLKFERASILTYLAWENIKPKEEAPNAFKELLSSSNKNIAIQSRIALFHYSIKEGDISIVEKMKKFLLDLDSGQVEVHVIASSWFILGNALDRTEDYKGAISCFAKSLALYDEAVRIYGMSAIDGLFNVYEQFGWAYVKNDQPKEGVQMFAAGANLAFDYGLTTRYERILFDFGYHLILLKEYEQAADVLEKHYQIIVTNEMFEQKDMKLIYGALAFSHWYSNQFEEAVELVGLFIIECAREHIKPPVSIAEYVTETKEFDSLDFFKRNLLLLLMPDDKSLKDFEVWADEVVKRKPELKEVLTSFEFVKNKPE